MSDGLVSCQGDSMRRCDVLVFCGCYDLFVTSLQDDSQDKMIARVGFSLDAMIFL